MVYDSIIQFEWHSINRIKTSRLKNYWHALNHIATIEPTRLKKNLSLKRIDTRLKWICNIFTGILVFAFVSINNVYLYNMHKVMYVGILYTENIYWLFIFLISSIIYYNIICKNILLNNISTSTINLFRRLTVLSPWYHIRTCNKFMKMFFRLRVIVNVF